MPSCQNLKEAPLSGLYAAVPFCEDVHSFSIPEEVLSFLCLTLDV